MQAITRNLKEELFGGWSKKETIYAWSLVLLQVLFYVVYPDSLLGFIAGVSGTICVLFVAKGKISNYFFGFIQTGILLVLGFQAGLIGETGENVFYFVTQFWGIYEWRKHMKSEVVGGAEKEKVVETRKMFLKEWLLLVVAVVVVTSILGYVFDSYNGTQPYLDAFTLVAALIGQTLMVLRYREQWLLWALLNIVSIYQWATLGNMSLVALFVAFLINTVYGYTNWSKLTKTSVQTEN